MEPAEMTKLLIGSARIKYSVLDDLFKKVNLPSGKVNFVIDGYALFSKLYQPEFIPDNDRVSNEKFIIEFVVATLNTLAHYRRYMATRMRRSNRIYIIWNRRPPEYQRELIPDYGESYYDKLSGDNFTYGVFNRILRQALNFLKETVQYFDGIYYLDTNKIEDHSIVYFLKEYHPKSNFVLFTKNELWLQFCDERTVILRPNRDKSKLITESNIGKILFKKTKYEGNPIDSDNVRHVLALGGCDSRDIEPVKGYRYISIAKAIDKLVNKGIYIPNMNIGRFVNMVNKVIRKPYTESEIETAITNFKCIDGKLSLEAIPEGKIKKVLQSRVDLYDAVAVQQLNEMLTESDNTININDLYMDTVEETESDMFNELNVFWMEG